MRCAPILVAIAIGCGPAIHPATLPAIEPTDLIEAQTYTSRVAGLRATLARSNIELDTAPVINTCAEHHGAHDCVRCDVASRANTGGVDPEMIDGVSIAFAAYPASVLAASKLAHVALCQKIRYAERASAEGPAGMAILADARMLISVEHFVGKTHDTFDYFTIEQVVHHELFHMFDYATRGAMFENDREWHALNPPGFAYRDPAGHERRPAGFVDTYATTNELEDRASVFEYLLGQPARLCEIAAVDPIVAAKTTVVWKRVAKVMGNGLLHRDAPCVGWIDPKAARPKPPRSTPKKPAKPVLWGPQKPSILGKMR